MDCDCSIDDDSDQPPPPPMFSGPKANPMDSSTLHELPNVKDPLTLSEIAEPFPWQLLRVEPTISSYVALAELPL